MCIDGRAQIVLEHERKIHPVKLRRQPLCLRNQRWYRMRFALPGRARRFDVSPPSSQPPSNAFMSKGIPGSRQSREPPRELLVWTVSTEQDEERRSPCWRTVSSPAIVTSTKVFLTRTHRPSMCIIDRCAVGECGRIDAQFRQGLELKWLRMERRRLFVYIYLYLDTYIDQS